MRLKLSTILILFCTNLVFATYEDFTTYSTGGDNIGELTITENKIAINESLLGRNEDAWVYDDKGAGHFDGDFTHQLEIMATAQTGGYGLFNCWILANAVGDAYDLEQASESYYLIELVEYADVYTIYVRIYEGGSEVDSDSYSGSIDTLYFLTIARDHDGGGSNKGRLTVTIRIESHTGEVQDTLTADSSAEQNTFRYIYGMAGYNTGGTGQIKGYVQNLDLNEEAGGEATVKGRVSIININ